MSGSSRKWYVEAVYHKNAVGIFEAPDPLQAALLARRTFKLSLQECNCRVWAQNNAATEYLKERGLVEPVVSGW